MPTWDETKRRRNIKDHQSTTTSAKLPISLPADATAWSKLIAEEPDAATPTVNEVAAQRYAVVVQGGGYAAVRDALAQKRQGQRGPQLAPTKLPVTVRYNPEVVAYFKATGAGWQTRMNDALCEWVAKHKTA